MTVANLKGGVGKTTTAVSLARNLKAVLVDADPQGIHVSTLLRTHVLYLRK